MLEAIDALLNSKRWVVAYSGGLDSSVLLHQLAAVSDRPPLHVVHVNHQLNPHADTWETHAKRCCDKLQVPLTVINVAVPVNQGRGLEDAARKARYKAFESVVEAGDVLMLAHHQDDQAETILLRLLRGAGARGLAGMPQQRAIGRGKLHRPLLNRSRADLAAYAEAHQLSYITDDSNQDETLDRNYLRHNVMPLLESRWPGFARNWAHSAEVLANTSEALDELAESDAKACGLRPETYGCSLQLHKVQSLSLLRAFGALRYGCEQFSLPVLPRNAFTAITQELFTAKQDAQPQVSWSGGEARRFAQCLYLLHKVPATSSLVDVRWQRSGVEAQAFEAAIEGVGRLSVDWLRPPPAHMLVRIGLRQGGEMIRSPGRSSKSLKQWFQEQDIPPWLRERTPLLFVQQELIAVGETIVSQSSDWEVKTICLTFAPN